MDFTPKIGGWPPNLAMVAKWVAKVRGGLATPGAHVYIYMARVANPDPGVLARSEKREENQRGG